MVRVITMYLAELSTIVGEIIHIIGRGMNPRMILIGYNMFVP